MRDCLSKFLMKNRDERAKLVTSNFYDGIEARGRSDGTFKLNKSENLPFPRLSSMLALSMFSNPISIR